MHQDVIVLMLFWFKINYSTIIKTKNLFF